MSVLFTARRWGVLRLAAALQQSKRRAQVPAFIGASLLLAFSLWAAAPSDEPYSDAVGAIQGEAIAVQGPMNVDVIHGQVKTVLRSGSDVHVRSGRARIDLAEGGQIAICGPAHLSVLKSGGALTVALETGTIHVHIEREPSLTIYTPQIVAKPIAIGNGPQDLLAGFDIAGAMCIRANAGAVRLETQLTGQSVVVPQTGDILITNGQLETLRDASGQHCVCEIPIAKVIPAAPPSPAAEVSRLATTQEIQEQHSDSGKEPLKPPSAPAREEPVVQVFMPPLSYDANAKVQPDHFDPALIVLVRKVRVRPALIFQGRVEGVSTAARMPSAPHSEPVATAPLKPVPSSSPAGANDSVVNRVRAFFRRLLS